METNGTTTQLTMMDEENIGNYSMNLCFRSNMTIIVALDETEKLLASLILSTIILIGTLTNPIMMVCICRIWSSNRSMCQHLLHLTIGDMVRVFFCLPVHLATSYNYISDNGGTNLLFQTKVFMNVFTEILQLLILLQISRDRYYAVAKPFEKYNKQNAKLICELVCSWGFAFWGAGCALYFYKDYVRMINACVVETQLFAFLLLFLMFESIIVIGIIQFYLRTIYFLLKRGKKMHVLRQTVHPFVPHSEVKNKSDPTCNVVRFESITEQKKKMVDNNVNSQIVDFVVPDFKYPEAKNAQSEVQTEIKINSNVSKGLTDSASVIPTSITLVPSNLSKDVNEKTTKFRCQKVTPENFTTDLSCREKKDKPSDIVADAVEFLRNSQDDGMKKLDIVINCTFNGIATKTEIVDDHNSSIVKPNKELPSFSRASVETETETSGHFSSENDGEFAQNTIPVEKIFVISQPVEFTVKSIQKLSVGLKEGTNIQRSCSVSKDKMESSIQLEKRFEILKENKQERTKKDSIPNIKIEIPGQIKVDDQTGNKKKVDEQTESTKKVDEQTKTKKKATFKESIERNAGMKLANDNLSLTTKRDAPSEIEATGSFQMINKDKTIINAAGPFCPMPKRSKVNQRLHKEVQVTQRIAILIIFLILCWIPLYAARFLQVLFFQRKQCCSYKQYKFVWWESLSASTSAINPCLYGILNVQLRNEFCRLIIRFRNFLTNCHCCR